uniref:Vacuolar protein sorting-associated protein 16 homolog n=1 Tax=Heterorhabditis bacteriophora TaxID=37862 RepID=A0A1I7XS72_HETBA
MFGSIDTSWVDTDGQYVMIAASSDHSKMAVYHTSRLIQVLTIDLSQLISRIRVPGQQSIYCFGWVGLEALFLQKKPNHLQFFNIKDETAVYDLDTDFTQIGIENDGIKLYSDGSVEFVSPVTTVTKSIVLFMQVIQRLYIGEERAVLGVASASGGALLKEAFQWLCSNKSHQSYEYAMQVRDMSLAIDQCISCAITSWSPELQKSLLKAAHFGMAFNTSFDSSRFVRVLRELRVLNEDLGETCLLNRLIDIGAYGLAVEMCRWLGRDQFEGVDRVLLEWVCLEIMVLNFLCCISNITYFSEFLPVCNTIFFCFTDAAKRAIDAKLPKLARLLIKRETDDSKQVNVLLQLGDIQEALTRAAAAQRPQLMHQVVRYLMKGQKRAEYELAIRKIPLAQCLYQDLVREESGRGPGRMILALLEQASDFERQIMLHLDAAEYEMNGVLISMSQAAFAPSQLERNQEHLTIRETVIEYAADTQKVNQFKHQTKLSEKQFVTNLRNIVKMARLWKKSEMLINGGIALSLYRSSRSRLVVAVGDVPGPMVNGCISFVTETNCDDGLPHTLEHLVFMGSKKYPYKGVLDIIANRCLASGTNAWTDQDHTAYTLSTVGC